MHRRLKCLTDLRQIRCMPSLKKRRPTIVSFVKIGSDSLALFSDVSKCLPTLSVFLCRSGGRRYMRPANNPAERF